MMKQKLLYKKWRLQWLTFIILKNVLMNIKKFEKLMYQYEEEQFSANIWYGLSIIGKNIVKWGAHGKGQSWGEPGFWEVWSLDFVKTEGRKTLTIFNVKSYNFKIA